LILVLQTRITHTSTQTVMHKPLLLGLILMSISSLFAQVPVSQVPVQPQSQLVDHQRAFLEWQMDNPQAVDHKGWKWYKRWEEHWSTRAMPDGSAPDPLLIQEEYLRYIRLKNANSTRASGWMPAGPDYLPPGAFPTSQHGMGRINCMAFHPTDSNTFWVGVAQGGVWKTTDHGDSWTPLTDDLPILRISDIAVNPNNPDEIYISVGDYAYLAVALDIDNRKRHTHYGIGVYKTINGGQTWSPTGLTLNQEDLDASLTRRVFIKESDDQELIAAGIYGMRKSYDGGATWTQVSDSVIWDIEHDPMAADVLYATSGYVDGLDIGTAVIMKSTDFGENWTVLNAPLPAKFAVQRVEVAVSPVDNDYVYAVACDMAGGFYGFYRSTDGGQTWTVRADSSTSDNLLHWYIPSFGAVGGQGTYDLGLLADPNDRDKIYVGGVNIWGSEDGGQSWGPATLWYAALGKSLHADQHYFTYNPIDGKYYICNDGGVMRTQNIQAVPLDEIFNDPNFEWPTVWEDLNDGMQITSFYRLGLSLSNPGATIAGAQDNSTFIYDGTNWINSFGGDGMEALIQPNDPLHLYGSSQFGRIVRSIDGGYTYETISQQMRDDPNELSAWTTPFMLEPGNPGILYAGYSNLWKSTDDGLNWAKISNFPYMPNTSFGAPASALAISPSDPRAIYMARRIYHSFGQPSEIWRTFDGGNTWTDVTAGLPDSLYFSYIAIDHTNPQRAWVTASGFVDGTKVYETLDGGNTWNNISRNLPNLPANCVIAQDSSDNALIYVAMDRGVYFLSDTLTDWQLYADNLPNVIVSELELHPQTNQLYISTFGRGIWVADQVKESADPVSIRGSEFSPFSAAVYPNPTEGEITVKIEGGKTGAISLELVDIMGRKVWEENRLLLAESQSLPISLEVSPGVYFLRISQQGNRRVVKFRVE